MSDLMKLTRRETLKQAATGAAALTFSGAFVPRALRSVFAAPGGSAATRKSVIILWMAGGPATIDLWDPKPGRPNGGPVRAIETQLPDVQISQYLPKTAQRMKDFAIIRSMKTDQADHARGHYLLHTGYEPNPTVRHPAFGAVCSAELSPEDFDIPSYVAIGGSAPRAGILGAAHDPFTIGNVKDPLAFVREAAGVDAARGDSRSELLLEREEAYAARDDEASRSRLEAIKRARRLMKSPLLDAFDLSKEKAELRAEYGNTPFGDACLLARRLTEIGVSCCEVVLGGWDTHRGNFQAVANLCRTLDPAMAALSKDLSDRGRLDKTLIVWMGEFGRTPRVNEFEGRDHYARAWCTVLGGAGIRGGQVLGKTDDDGEEVLDRPVSAPDLLATACLALGIDPRKENYSAEGRPIKIVKDGSPVRELFAAPPAAERPRAL
jgi:hypothetical protein